ncbi:MAG: aldose 1-epimerase family protein [Phycisphaerae bacterium]|nr:aldose 1-epimerase family protein [Phycisphaerae bacterium]
MAKKTNKSVAKNDHPFANVPVINPHQLGGIETSVLDNGPGRGVRVAWVNTGGGLRYKVVIDRGLDIADADYRGDSLTWHSYGGVTAPEQAYHRGIEWIRGFYGGLLVSCGPLNTGGPFTENGQEFSLHGTHSNTAAIVESIVNPDLSRGQLDMSITAIIKTARVFGPNVELRRTLSSRLGENFIRIQDVFTNHSNVQVPHCWLYHINFGYPLLEPGASVYCYRGNLMPRGDSVEWFKRKDYRTAPPPLEIHRGFGEVFSYIDAKGDSKGNVLAGIVNRKRGFGVKVEYNRKQFPRLGNWQHWGPGGSYTGAIEPMTAGVEGRPKDVERGWVRQLQPGETISFDSTITATSDSRELNALLALNK